MAYEYRRRLIKEGLYQQLTPGQKVVLSTLTDYADVGMICWPSTATLVKDTGCSQRTVLAAIRRLRQLGFVEEHRDPKAPMIQKFALRVPKIAVIQPEPPEEEFAHVEAEIAHVEAEIAPPTRQNLPAEEANFAGRREHEESKVKEQEKSPPTPPARACEGGGWGFDLLRAYRDFGLKQTEPLQRFGEDVARFALGRAKAEKWGPGLLYHKLTTGSPDVQPPAPSGPTDAELARANALAAKRELEDAEAAKRASVAAVKFWLMRPRSHEEKAAKLAQYGLTEEDLL